MSATAPAILSRSVLFIVVRGCQPTSEEQAKVHQALEQLSFQPLTVDARDIQVEYQPEGIHDYPGIGVEIQEFSANVGLEREHLTDLGQRIADVFLTQVGGKNRCLYGMLHNDS